MTGRDGPAREVAPGGRAPEFWYTLAIAPELRARHPELPLALNEALARGEPHPAPEAVAESEAIVDPPDFPEAGVEARLHAEVEAEAEI
jgi:hypothetical protein